jgi:DNA topoisomerase-1
MKVRRGKGKPFLGCTGYPKCRGTQQIPEELQEKVQKMLPPPAPKAPAVEVNEPCPDCGGPMLLRKGRFGSWFLGCKSYPKCEGKREATPDILDMLEESSVV